MTPKERRQYDPSKQPSFNRSILLRFMDKKTFNRINKQYQQAKARGKPFKPTAKELNAFKKLKEIGVNGFAKMVGIKKSNACAKIGRIYVSTLK